MIKICINERIAIYKCNKKNTKKNGMEIKIINLIFNTVKK